jgi:hypothetical protein
MTSEGVPEGVCNKKGPICMDLMVEINSIPPVFLVWYGGIHRWYE